MPELRRPRHIESVADLCEAAVELVREAGWAEHDVTRVALAIGEAVANAVEHGGGDEVLVEFDADARRLAVRVADGGPGLAPERLDRAALPDDPAATCGRGLFILQHVTDDVDVDASGALRFIIRPTG
ncbi:hypothetical protein BSZ37_13270 [Rubrivirga marina]|uniref:Histidine kinase/HSP90-like ATPase domain-containing protein n=1 Tax=Rubrivirga marina TaxID=1196024 RepID=A0A271J2Z3_9BACT|nr:hypothetical protein BSZ37_13270 [Rubrivirga marina]